MDQLKLDPKSRWQRVTVVLIRPGFFWAPENATRVQQLFPVLLVAGYEARPEQFESGLADFDSLLGRIAFVPTEFAADAPQFLACACSKKSIRVVVASDKVLSPDLGGKETECVQKICQKRHWDLNMRKSFVIRAKDASH